MAHMMKPFQVQKANALHNEITESVKSSIQKAIQIGELLSKAKAEQPHGTWLEFVKANYTFSPRMAQNYLRLYRNKDELNAKPVSHLKDAINLLAEPKDDEPVEINQELQIDNGSAEPEASDSDGDEDSEVVDDPQPNTEPKGETATVTMHDEVGEPVPDHLVPIFAARKRIKAYLNLIDKLKKNTKADVQENPDLWFYFRQNPWEVEMANVRRQYRFALPYAVCVYCGGDPDMQCTACRGKGYLNEDLYRAAPAELKS